MTKIPKFNLCGVRKWEVYDWEPECGLTLMSWHRSLVVALRAFKKHEKWIADHRGDEGCPVLFPEFEEKP